MRYRCLITLLFTLLVFFFAGCAPSVPATVRVPTETMMPHATQEPTRTPHSIVLPSATPASTLPQPTPYPVSVAPISATRRILFVENNNLFTIQANGLEMRQLTDTVGRIHSPSWSPDGQRIAFIEAQHEQGDIFVMQADGSQRINLTNDPADYAGTYWAPDGHTIVFSAPGTQGQQRDLFATRMDGSQPINLTDHPARDEFISWSPDSTHIVYRSYRGGATDRNGDLFVVRADGTTRYRLTENTRRDIPLQWSPDGAHLLLYELETNHIVIVARDGSLVYPLAESAQASWSPDGTQIAFTTHERDIYGISIDVIQVNGTAQRPVTLDEHMLDSAPAWSPNGAQIAFGRRDARPAYFADNGLYVVNADGSELRQLVYLQSGGVAATWSPDGAHLLYTVDGGPGTMGVYPKPPDTIYVVGLDGTEPRAITEGWGAQWQP